MNFKHGDKVKFIKQYSGLFYNEIGTIYDGKYLFLINKKFRKIYKYWIKYRECGDKISFLLFDNENLRNTIFFVWVVENKDIMLLDR